HDCEADAKRRQETPSSGFIVGCRRAIMSSMSSSGLWTSFWQRFRADGYTERPSSFPMGQYPGLGVSADSIFCATVKMSDEFRRMSRANRITFSNIRFYMDGQRIEDPSAHLMRQEDGDFRSWHRRLETITDDYCVVFNRLESTFGHDIGKILE